MVEIIPSAGGASREVYRAPIWDGGGRYNTLIWTPDQRFLLFVQDDGNLWKVAASGGIPEKVGFSIKGKIKNPAVHPDGRRVAFGLIQDESEVWALENFLSVTK